MHAIFHHFKLRCLCVISILLVGCGGGDSSPPPESSVSTSSSGSTSTPLPAVGQNEQNQYHLTFDEEFNALSFTNQWPGNNKWSTTDFYGSRVNTSDHQDAMFVDPTITNGFIPFSTSQGVLAIAAKPVPVNYPENTWGANYLSGQITGAHKYTQRYGYYELRAKPPSAQGTWSRFWLLPDDGAWPNPGEYDIFEILNDYQYNWSGIFQTTHYPCKPSDCLKGKLNSADGFKYNGINVFDGNFHTFGFLWTKDEVVWYVDGVETLRQANRINVPMYVLIDLAIGQTANYFAGKPLPNTTWPQAMEVDYFRIYSNDPSLPSVNPDANYTKSVLPNNYSVVTSATTGPLPVGWTIGAIGSPDLPGTSTWNPITGEWIVKGAGYGRQGQFASTALPGNGEITATVTSVTKINTNDVRAGVAIRSGRQPADSEVALVYRVAYSNQVSPTIDTKSISLEVNGQSVGSVTIPSTNTSPVTLRLNRTGITYSGSYSMDSGNTWANVPVAILNPSNPSVPSGNAVAGIIVGGNQNSYRKMSRGIFTNVGTVNR